VSEAAPQQSHEHELYVPLPLVVADFPDEPWTPWEHHAVEARPESLLLNALDHLWYTRCLRKGWLTRHEDEGHIYFAMPRYTVEHSRRYALGGLETLTVGEVPIVRRSTRFLLRRADTGE
jgi:hypothetical protein